MEFIIKALKERNAQDIKEMVKKSRDGLEDLAKLLKVPKDVICVSLDVKGISAEWVSAPEARKDKIIFYLHGGGYVSGSLNSAIASTSNISHAGLSGLLLGS